MGKEAKMMITGSAGCILVLCMVAMAVPLQAQGISCQTVVNNLIQCETYLKQGGNLPAECCSGVSSLNDAANTPAQRKIVCQCLKVAAKAYQVNPQYASSLPADCHVNIPYPISYSTDFKSLLTLGYFNIENLGSKTQLLPGSIRSTMCNSYCDY